MAAGSHLCSIEAFGSPPFGGSCLHTKGSAHEMGGPFSISAAPITRKYGGCRHKMIGLGQHCMPTNNRAVLWDPLSRSHHSGIPQVVVGGSRYSWEAAGTRGRQQVLVGGSRY